MGLGGYLFVSAILFGLGVACTIARRNVIYVLMGIELILNAANLNLVAFARFNGGLDGQLFAIFSIILAAAEAAIALRDRAERLRPLRLRPSRRPRPAERVESHFSTPACPPPPS